MIDSFYKTLIYDDRYKYILEGLKNTLVIAFFAILIGIILGILISLVKNRYKENGKGKILNGIANIYVTIIRGTPAVLQLMILYYVIFKKVDINIVIVGIISFGTHVEVHELSTTEISRSYVFNGKKEYTTSKVADMLGLRGNVMQSQVSSSSSYILDWCCFFCFSFYYAYW